MSVKLTDRPIPDEDYWFNKHFVQDTMLTKFLDLFSVGKLVVANWSSDLKLFIFATKKSSVESAKDSKLSSFQQPWGSDGREPLQS